MTTEEKLRAAFSDWMVEYMIIDTEHWYKLSVWEANVLIERCYKEFGKKLAHWLKE